MATELRVFYYERSRDLNRQIKKLVEKEPHEVSYDFKARCQDFYFRFDSLDEADAAADRILPLRKQYPRRIYVNICHGVS